MAALTSKEYVDAHSGGGGGDIPTAVYIYAVTNPSSYPANTLLDCVANSTKVNELDDNQYYLVQANIQMRASDANQIVYLTGAGRSDSTDKQSLAGSANPKITNFKQMQEIGLTSYLGQTTFIFTARGSALKQRLFSYILEDTGPSGTNPNVIAYITPVNLTY